MYYTMPSITSITQAGTCVCFLFLAGARRLELSPCNTQAGTNHGTNHFVNPGPVCLSYSQTVTTLSPNSSMLSRTVSRPVLGGLIQWLSISTPTLY